MEKMIQFLRFRLAAYRLIGHPGDRFYNVKWRQFTVLHITTLCKENPHYVRIKEAWFFTACMDLTARYFSMEFALVWRTYSSTETMYELCTQDTSPFEQHYTFFVNQIKWRLGVIFCESLVKRGPLAVVCHRTLQTLLISQKVLFEKPQTAHIFFFWFWKLIRTANYSVIY